MGETAKRISRGKVMHEEKVLTHVDLFSGIGGFALAAQWAGFRTVAFCEIELFCQEVLKARFGAIANTKSERLERRGHGETRIKKKAVRLFSTRSIKRPILYSDIRDFDGTRFRGATLLTGGFPCQPFSCAGKRKGKEDNRHLWPEMLRVISEARSAWVIGENVAGIVNMELEQVCLDLENEGYEVRPIIIPACAVNAPHRRNRVWILAHNATGGRCLSGSSNKQRRQVQNIEVGKIKENEPEWSGWIGRAFKGDSDAPDAGDTTTTRQRGNGRAILPITESKGLNYHSWDILWPEVALRTCVRGVDDGVPRRVDRLKALGNAIVPQVAYEIIKEISEIEGMSI